MHDASIRQLDAFGFVLLPNIMSGDLLTRLRAQIERLYRREGESAGAEFKHEPGCRRLANLVNKGAVFQEVIAHPSVLPLIDHVLGGSVKLSSLNARRVNPHGELPQPLHCDMGAVPDEHGNWVCNAVWMLDDFTFENGALRVVPQSHRWKCLPQSKLDNLLADHPQQIVVTGSAGSVIVMNAHLWHGGMVNRSDDPRTAVHAFYCRRDKPQQQCQKELLDRELQNQLPTAVRDLLALDDPTQKLPAARSGFLD